MSIPPTYSAHGQGAHDSQLNYSLHTFVLVSRLPQLQQQQSHFGFSSSEENTRELPSFSPSSHSAEPLDKPRPFDVTLALGMSPPPKTASFSVVHHPSGSLCIINTTPSPQATTTNPITTNIITNRLLPLCIEPPASASPPSLCPIPHLPHPTPHAEAPTRSEDEPEVAFAFNTVPYGLTTSARVPNTFFRNSGVGRRFLEGPP